MPVCALPWPRGLFIQFAHLLNGSSAPHFAHSALQNVSYGAQAGSAMLGSPAIPPNARYSEVFVPRLSFDFSLYVLLHPHLWLLSAASKFCFLFSFPISAGLGLPTACCVQCPAAGREWRAVSVSSHTQQPWVVAMAQHQSKLGERTGNVDCGSVILSLAWFLDKPEVVCGPGRRGGLMGSLGM